MTAAIFLSYEKSSLAFPLWSEYLFSILPTWWLEQLKYDPCIPQNIIDIPSDSQFKTCITRSEGKSVDRTEDIHPSSIFTYSAQDNRGYAMDRFLVLKAFNRSKQINTFISMGNLELKFSVCLKCFKKDTGKWEKPSTQCRNPPAEDL